MPVALSEPLITARLSLVGYHAIVASLDVCHKFVQDLSFLAALVLQDRPHDLVGADLRCNS